MQIVIVEDEQLAAQRLLKLIKSHVPEVELLSQPDSVEEAVAFFKEATPDLAFFDIQLADGISFEIFDHVKVTCPIIFTTAYDDYALKAFKVNSVDYLLKPIDESELIKALDRFKSRQVSPRTDFEELLKGLQATKRFKQRFFVRTGSQLSFVSTEDVAFFVSASSTTFLVTKDNERFVIDQTLDELEACVDPQLFFRINRGCVLSLRSIQKMEPYLNNRLLVHTSPVDKEEMVVSRQRVKHFKDWLDQ